MKIHTFPLSFPRKSSSCAIFSSSPSSISKIKNLLFLSIKISFFIFILPLGTESSSSVSSSLSSSPSSSPSPSPSPSPTHPHPWSIRSKHKMGDLRIVMLGMTGNGSVP